MTVGRNEPCLRQRAEVQALPPPRRRGGPTDLQRFVKSGYSLALLDEAWREFTPFEDKGFVEDSIHMPVFMPWFFYEWKPDPEATLVPREEVGSFPVASAYLKRSGRYQDPLTTWYLRACLGSAFSFLDVLTVSPGTVFTVRDSLTGLETTVV